MRAQRWIAAAVAGALAGAAGALVSAAGRGEAIATADGFGAGDGLARYVVTLDLAAAADALPAPDGSGAQRASAGASSSRPSLDVDLLAEAQRDLGPGGQVQWRDDGAWYVADGGAARVGTAGSGTDSAGSGSGQAAVSEPVAWPILPEDLVAGGGSVQPLGEGRYLLASDLDLDEVRALPGVAAVEPSVSVPVAAVPDDPYYGPYGWNLHNTGTNAYGQPALAGADVGAPEAWATTTGEGTVVAVVDTGYDHDHPELAAALWTNPTEQCGGGDTNGNGLAGDCHGWNFYANGPDVDNGASGSHGTSVSGTVAAALGNGHGSAGLAPGTRIMPLVVGGGENVDVLLAARAFRYAADNGADVINASFGGSMTGYALDQLSAAVDYAVERGVLVVVAAGNDGADRDTAPVYPASLPQDGIVTVGSSTAVDEIAAHSA